jgi:DMSO/TMAO reductase YedYZ molybdopterin-dependent catalytic subunit
MPKALKPNPLQTKTIRKPVSAPAKVADIVELNPIKSATIAKPVNDTEPRPKNLKANILPTEGYVLEIDGKFKTEYVTSEEALKAGLELKEKYPQIQVKVYDAKKRTRTPVELPEQSEDKNETAS